MASEIELKLDVSPDAAAAIEGSELLQGPPERIEQHATYYDTPGRALSGAGLSLRIRRAGEARIQTIKASGGSTAGLFARSEWERPVEGDVPILDDTNPIGAVLGKASRDIGAIFVVRIERRTWMVREGDASIELVIDRGEVTAADRSSPIVEIELELKKGAPAALFAFARRLDAIAPVRAGVLSKSERGYRLSEAAGIAVKAAPVPLDADMTAAEAFRRIVHACVRQFRLNEALLAQGRHADTLHQARVSLRRLRSAFSIFRPIAQGPEADRLREELRWLAAELGEARDLDVLLARADSGPVRDRIAAAREDSYDRVEQALADRRVRALMLDLLEWTAAGEWLERDETEEDRRRPARDFAAGALDRFRRKVKKDGRDLVHAGDEARHEVRKDAKKLRYASEFFRPLFDHKRERRRYKVFLVALEELQDQLGRLNDLASAPAVLQSLGVESAAWTETSGKEALLVAAAEAQEELVDAKRFWR